MRKGGRGQNGKEKVVTSCMDGPLPDAVKSNLIVLKSHGHPLSKLDSRQK